MQKNAPRNFEVEVNQRVYKVAVTDTSPAVAPADTASVQKRRALPDRSSAKAAVAGANAGEVRTTMNGLVKELLVKEGDLVSAGQKIAIFEAMKMEQEIFAGTGGKVTKIAVKAGDTVEASALLMLISEK